jgi:hypothetical protein
VEMGLQVVMVRRGLIWTETITVLRGEKLRNFDAKKTRNAFSPTF